VIDMDKIAPVVIGFLLTTVIGGLLGFLFQRRAWSHQHAVQVHEQERERAVAIFEEVSRLMDRRLYRLRLLFWSLPKRGPGGSEHELATRRLEDYRQVLFDWNDNINRNLALLQQYFGSSFRYSLDHAVGGRFVTLGGEVERLWRKEKSTEEESSYPPLESAIVELSHMIYFYNIELIKAIQSDSFGKAIGEVSQGRRPIKLRRKRRPHQHD
jgi:hypothetical protein